MGETSVGGIHTRERKKNNTREGRGQKFPSSPVYIFFFTTVGNASLPEIVLFFPNIRLWHPIYILLAVFRDIRLFGCCCNIAIRGNHTQPRKEKKKRQTRARTNFCIFIYFLFYVTRSCACRNGSHQIAAVAVNSWITRTRILCYVKNDSNGIITWFILDNKVDILSPTKFDWLTWGNNNVENVDHLFLGNAGSYNNNTKLLILKWYSRCLNMTQQQQSFFKSFIQQEVVYYPTISSGSKFPFWITKNKLTDKIPDITSKKGFCDNRRGKEGRRANELYMSKVIFLTSCMVLNKTWTVGTLRLTQREENSFIRERKKESPEQAARWYNRHLYIFFFSFPIAS